MVVGRTCEQQHGGRQGEAAPEDQQEGGEARGHDPGISFSFKIIEYVTTETVVENISKVLLINLCIPNLSVNNLTQFHYEPVGFD